MAKHTQRMMTRETQISGPVVLTPDAMAGIADGYPIEVINNIDYYIYHNDFHRDADFDSADFTTTTFTGATVGIKDSSNEFGQLQISASGAGQGALVQHDRGSADAAVQEELVVTGAAHVLPKEAFFACRFRVSNASLDNAIFVGLAESNGTSSVFSGGATPSDASTITSDEHIGFYMNSSNPGQVYWTVAGTADTSAITGEAFNLTHNAFVDVAFRFWDVDQYWIGYRPRGRNSRKWSILSSGTLSSPFTSTTLLYPTFGNVGDASADRLDIDFFTLCRYRDYYISDELTPSANGDYVAV